MERDYEGSQTLVGQITSSHSVEGPPADIFEGEHRLKIVAELPGVEEKNIKVDLDDNELFISADTPGRKYHGKIVQPFCARKRVRQDMQEWHSGDHIEKRLNCPIVDSTVESFFAYSIAA